MANKINVRQAARLAERFGLVGSSGERYAYNIGNGWQKTSRLEWVAEIAKEAGNTIEDQLDISATQTLKTKVLTYGIGEVMAKQLAGKPLILPGFGAAVARYMGFPDNKNLIAMARRRFPGRNEKTGSCKMILAFCHVSGQSITTVVKRCGTDYLVSMLGKHGEEWIIKAAEADPGYSPRKYYPE
jgi:hypothetical protein